MLGSVRIVLVNTSHPGNIGSVARAMKTMGIGRLYLVSPALFPHPKANEMATGAGDLLEGAVVVDTLDQAIGDCTFIAGTSARKRTVPWPLWTPKQLAQHIKGEHMVGQIAIVFGREQSGLTNDELQRCHVHVNVPASPHYSSLNIAAAVQVIAYELRLASLDETVVQAEWDQRPATMDEMEKFFEHLQKVLIETSFLNMDAPRKLMVRMRRLFLRARPDAMEMNMLRGMLSAVQSTITKT